MGSVQNELTDWDPMFKDYKDKSINKYESGPGAQLDRDASDYKFPCLVIQTSGFKLFDVHFENYFGDGIVKQIDYNRNIQKYFVYFLNYGAVEQALRKLENNTWGLKYEVGRPRPQNVEKPKQDVAVEPRTTYGHEAENTKVDLNNRNLIISASSNEHPVFLKKPLVGVKDYTAKDSLLAQYDVNRRYLNVKYEFVLERNNYFFINKQSEYLCRSGRVQAVSISEKSDQCCDGKFQQCTSYTSVRCNNCQKETSVIPELKSEFPPVGSVVQITAFEQSNVVYIRSMDNASNVSYFHVLAAAMLDGSSAHPLPNLPKVGQIVLYKFNGMFNRAMVLNVEQPQEIYVVCIDFGNVEITEIENLYECSARVAGLPRYAFPVLLRGVQHRYLTPDVCRILYNVLDVFNFTLKYSECNPETGMHRVVLIAKEINSNLNSWMKKLLNPDEPVPSNTVFDENYLNVINMPTGKNIELAITDNSFLKYGIVFGTTWDLACEVTLMQHDINAYGEAETKTSFYAPPKGKLCLAKYKGKWCRGVCKDLVGDGFPSIMFIDYGNIIPVAIDDIRPYPPKLKCPVLTLEFSIIGFPEELTKDAAERMEHLLPVGETVTCDELIRNEDGNYSLRIDKLLPYIKAAAGVDNFDYINNE